MADMQNPQHPLKVLSSSLVLVLHQTGKLLRDQTLWNPRQSGITQKRINEFVPFANQQFHEALDEIESEILQAKAVMERDLSLLRKKRIERERIANGLKAQPSPEDATRLIPLSEDEPPETSRPSNAAQSHEETNGDDTMMINSGLEAGLIGSNDEPQSEAPQSKDKDKDKDNITGDSGMPHDAENSMGLAITVAQDSTETIEPPKSPGKKPSGATPGAEAPLDAADLDFESMFNDTDLTGGDNTMNFGLDFSSDGNLNQDVLNDSAFENIEMSNVDISNLGATTSEDINTLLPGLENYVNAGTDFSNINIPILSTLPDTSQGANAGNVSATAQVSAQPAAADSSFDDIFGSGDYSMGGTEDDGLGAGTLGDFEDFDEDWFKSGS